ncbi:hypothetical protein ASPACDRAFT_1854219 [Aspergillus aculeatus ATCC 16872]|uniref:Uncharacterized protein n=1 Tax=Aspergillus aculeatus (strain ATCC 16872 / CBS 172.66 / WB 5094) TaxID=690307 RepID=A0A1L9X1C6_ASPA1|nr:uncharacterized protein ASPACDRAFT_1854219 [Aspergillus aculeatus ATCC 16872]OJK02233.1 hypothetical protein ASPACDRAFT_1854219 [Aspergillus aculeatus ATCC 16872]
MPEEAASMLPAAARLKLRQDRWLETLSKVFLVSEGYIVRRPPSLLEDLYRVVTVEIFGNGRCFVVLIIEPPVEEENKSAGWERLDAFQRDYWFQPVRGQPRNQDIYGALQMGDEVIFTNKGPPEKDGGDASASRTFEAETVLSWDADMAVIDSQLEQPQKLQV